MPMQCLFFKVFAGVLTLQRFGRSVGKTSMVICHLCALCLKVGRDADNVVNANFLNQVSPDQIVMSQTPLEMFHEYHDKWCLVSGPEHDGGSRKVAEK